MDKTALTRKQQQFYDYIREYIAARQRPPSVRELCIRFDINSPNGVMCHLKALEKKGWITREAGTSRNIVLTDRPKCPHCGLEI